MSLTDIVQFGNILCQFDHFGTGIFNDIWSWKVDPYRMIARTEKPMQLMIGNAYSAVPDADMLLHEEYSGFFKRQIFQLADGGTLWSFVRSRNGEIYLQYMVNSSGNQIQLVMDSTQTAGHLAFEYLGLIIPYVLLNHQTLTFHGVLMEHHGKGIIISAPSGTGKTTHARMWRDTRNALIINGDRATCQKVDGIWTGFGLPWSGTSGEQINRRVPITAIVVLERGDINQAQQITKPLEAFTSLLPHIQYPSWDIGLAGKAMDLLDDFLQEIPVIRLRCKPEPEAVDILEKVIETLQN